MSDLICNSCGKTNKVAGVYCVYCGAVMPAEPFVEIAPAPSPAPMSFPPPSKEEPARTERVRVCQNCGKHNTVHAALCSRCNMVLINSPVVDVPAGSNESFIPARYSSAPAPISGTRVSSNEVVITGVNISFSDWVSLLVKVALASIPAMIIVAIVILAGSACLTSVFGISLLRLFSR